ncbi:hypothetical protein M8J75_007108 [Diaphorina citri]|nr:hypothetical protein M8J75_012788 [Diaphorina citri]KAI5694874.1 hypothetical protein M8J75_007108 [Diaphorina citri]
MHYFLLFGAAFLVLSVSCVQDCSGESTPPQTGGGYKKICYFTNWAIYRTGKSGNYSAENIDFAYCNFVVYAFAGLDGENNTLRITDAFADLPDGGGHGLIGKVVSRVKASGAVPVIALGGWNESNNTAYPVLFNNESLQDAFVTNTVVFLKKYGFQGLDLDYEYPQCPLGVCKPGDSDKKGFSKLVVKLRTEFNKHGFYLSAAVSAVISKIDTYYEPTILQNNLHWLGLMAYDFHKAAVEGWLAKGVSPDKLVLGVPMYGVSYTLADKTKNTIGSPANGPGFQKRALFYNEICELVKNEQWTQVTKENDKPVGGTYAYKDDQWTGYDNVNDAQYIQEKHLAGYMIWALDQDDFNGVCKGGKYPLLSTLSKTIDTN